MDLERYVILRVLERGEHSTRDIRTKPSHYPFDDSPRSAVLGAEDRAGLRVELAVEDLDQREVADLSRNPEVAAAALEIPVSLIEPAVDEAESAPTDTVAWGVREVGAVVSDLDGAGVKAAVLDTGIDANHDAFVGMELTQVDFTGDGNGDRNGHGTHCGATLFGKSVRGIRIGVAPGITEAFIGKVLDDAGSGNSASLAQAIVMAADSGCQVISMSLSFNWPKLIQRLIDEKGFSKELAAAVGLHHYRRNVRLFDRLGSYIASRGHRGAEVLLVAASGNDSDREAQPPFEMPAAPPSEAEGFVSVGAVGLEPGAGGKLVVANFSNSLCDVCAPGVGILSAKANTKSGLVRLSGTSMATPHVAGVAALWLQHLSAGATLPASHFIAPSVLRQRVEGGARSDRLHPSVNRLAVGLGVVQGPTPRSDGG